MAQAVDPFEEYLRKKKVEMLEQQLREESTSVQEEDEPLVLAEEDPSTEERLREEMQDFFDTGQSAGAEFFSKVGGDLNEENVEEIKDALDEVFEEEKPRPKVEKQGETFVEFFKEIQRNYKGKEASRADPAPLELEDADPSEVVEPPPPPRSVRAPRVAEAEPVDVTPEEVMSTDIAPEKPAVDTAALASELESQEMEIAAALASELESQEMEIAPAVVAQTESLNLSDLLAAPPADLAELQRRVELLSRLVSKLVERSKLGQNEILEVLIKSGIEF